MVFSMQRVQPVRRALGMGLLAAALGMAGLAQAQSGTPIRILVGFPAGAGTDAIARTLGEKLKDELGAPVVVENRAGAGGQIAAQRERSRRAAEQAAAERTHPHVTVAPAWPPGRALWEDGTPHSEAFDGYPRMQV